MDETRDTKIIAATADWYRNTPVWEVLADPTLPQRDGSKNRHAFLLLDIGLLRWVAPHTYQRTVEGDRVLSA